MSRKPGEALLDVDPFQLGAAAAAYSLTLRC
jgi:hypothetical protein